MDEFQNPFWPETGLQAFRQLKALTWTWLGIAAGHEIAVWHAADARSWVQSPTAPATHTSLCGKFSHALPATAGVVLPRLWRYVSLPRLPQTWKFLCSLMASRHEGPSPNPEPEPVQAWAGRRFPFETQTWSQAGIGGACGWCHLRLLQCSLRLMFDLVLQ